MLIENGYATRLVRADEPESVVSTQRGVMLAVAEVPRAVFCIVRSISFLRKFNMKYALVLKISCSRRESLINLVYFVF